VSPLSTDEVSLWLAPDRVEITRRRGFFAPKRVHSQTIVVREDPAIAVVDRLAAAVDEAIAGSRAQGAAVRITLSNALVRYAVIRWQPGIVRAADQEALARATYRSIYGELADAWVISLGERRPGASFVAAAIDRSLIDALARVAAGGGHRLTSVSPLFARAYDACSRGRRRDGWFATVEPGQICAGYAQAGSWQLLRSRNMRRFMPEELLILLDQARFAEGVERPAGLVNVFWRGLAPVDFGQHSSGWAFAVAGSPPPPARGRE